MFFDRFKSDKSTLPVPSAAPPPSTVFLRPSDWESRTRRGCDVSAVTLAVVLSLPAFVCLLLASLGVVAFLSGDSSGGIGILPVGGYQMDVTTGAYGIATIFIAASGANAGLLTSLVIIPLSAAFIGVAMVLAGVGHFMNGPKLAFAALTFATVAFALSLAGFVIGMLVFAPVRTYNGTHPKCHYGIANWLVLGAVVCLFCACAIRPELTHTVARGSYQSARDLEVIKRASELQPGPMLLAPASGWSASTPDSTRKTHYVEEVEEIEDGRGRRRHSTVERFSRMFDRR